MACEIDISPIVGNRRVAIVGHAKSIRGSGYGPEIDGYDVVIRCNLLDVPSGWESDMGLKCNLWYAGAVLDYFHNRAYRDSGHKNGVPICGKKPEMMRRIYDCIDPLSADTQKIPAGTWSCTGIVGIFDCLFSGALEVGVYGFDFYGSPDIHNWSLEDAAHHNKPVIRRSLDNDLARLRLLWFDKMPVRYDVVLDDLVRGGGMTVIISAFGTSDLLRRCLDAFRTQINRTGIDIELLVGSDGCDDCRKVLTNQDVPVNAWHFPQNHGGPYIVFNTLAQRARHQYLVFFGADDTPRPDFTDNIARIRGAKDIIRLAYRKEVTSGDPDAGAIGHAHGAFGISRTNFDRLGGFQPWSVAADTEFMWRAKQMGMTQVFAECGRPVFVRGVHPRQLTASSVTGFKSKVRTELSARIGKTIGRIEPQTDECDKI